MESSMASWYQASSSEYGSYSPSQSPSPPPSPTLYYYNAKYGHDEDEIKAETTGNKALNASNLLQQLEEFGYQQQFNEDSSSASSLGWTGVGDELSVNLELFGDLDLCAPLTPPGEDDFKIQQQLLMFEDAESISAASNTEILSNEFQAIIDSLPVSQYVVHEGLTDESEALFSIVSPDTPAEGEDQEDDFVSLMEVEVEEHVSMDSADDHISEKILDALLEGNLLKAESYIPKTLITATPINIVEITGPSSSRQHPKKKTSKPRLSSKTDKVSRKKEQNKTAATRYREKKKLQATIITQQEDELSAINDKLASQRDDLKREVLLVKQLLRDVIAAKRRKPLRK